MSLAATPAAAAGTGSVSGTVTAAGGGGPLSGVCVGAYEHGVDPPQLLVDAATTADGSYSLANVPAGPVDVRFSGTGFCPGGVASGLVTEWYSNQATETTANVVTVANGADSANVDAAMVVGGTITGQVSAAAGGGHLKGICVAALIPGGDDALVASTATLANGTYALTGVPAGSLHVEFFSSGFCPGGTASSYVTQWYNGRVTSTDADLVTVTKGATTSGINAALDAAGSISGTVTAANGGAPLSGICVAAYLPYVLGVAPQLVTSVGTNPDGTYALDGAPVGPVDVKFFSTGFCPGGLASNYVMQWFDNQPLQESATPVTVVAGATSTHVNAALTSGGSLSGRVTAAAGGAGLFGMCVAAFSTGADPVVVASTGTNSDGTYTLDGVTPGTVRVRFNSQGFCPGGVAGDELTQWFNGQPDFASADDVTVALGATTPNINAALVATTTPTSFTITVGGGASATVARGSSVTLAEHGLPGGATGTVVFSSSGDSNICTITLPATSCSTSSLAVGSYGPISAIFTSADSHFSDSSATNTVALSVDAVVPGAPTNAHAVNTAGAVKVTWTAPANNGGAAITGSRVVAAPGGKTVTVAGAAATATFTGLAPGSYTFTVRAQNRAGFGAVSSASNRVTIAAPVAHSGYWMLGAKGTVYAFGDAKHFGDAPGPVVAMAARRDGSGYWTVDATGTVSHFGAAAAHGGHPALRAGEAVSTISATPSGNGYWLFTNRGRAFAYGDAHDYGDMSKVTLNGAIIASSATPTGHGYYMVGSDGGVFTFGDAKFHGSTGAIHLNRPIVGISPTPDNRGYWLVASDGGVFAFKAPFRGSMGHTHLNKPVNGLVAFGNGYLMVASDGGAFNFSDKPFSGSFGAHPPAAPIIGITAFSTLTL